MEDFSSGVFLCVRNPIVVSVHRNPKYFCEVRSMVYCSFDRVYTARWPSQVCDALVLPVTNPSDSMKNDQGQSYKDDFLT